MTETLKVEEKPLRSCWTPMVFETLGGLSLRFRFIICFRRTLKYLYFYFNKSYMNYTERRIVESYTELFEGLSSSSKVELIENLSKSLKTDKQAKDEAFYKTFGAFASAKSPEEIIKEIKGSRKFRKKEIKF